MLTHIIRSSQEHRHISFPDNFFFKFGKLKHAIYNFPFLPLLWVYVTYESEYHLLASPQKDKTGGGMGENGTVQFKVKMLDSSFGLASQLKLFSSQYYAHCSLSGNILLRVLLGLVLLWYYHKHNHKFEGVDINNDDWKKTTEIKGRLF